jgi:hypothetical protein
MSISDPSLAPVNGVVDTSAAPGAMGPGGQMGMTTAVILPIATAAAALVALGIIFRKGGALPPLRVDAINAINCWASVTVINGTIKVLCYKYHGHKLAQSYLLIA